MRLKLPYGSGFWEEDVPELCEALFLRPAEVLNPVPNLDQAISQALASPLGSPRLRDLARPDDTVAVVISDATRPSPSNRFLKGLLSEFEQACVPLENVTVVVGTGTHRPSTPEELVKMVGEEHLVRLRVVVHKSNDAASQVYLGETRRGVPVWLNRAVVEASLRVATGVITPHHSLGYSGGRKAILPGVAGDRTVHVHHSSPIHPARPAFGRLEGNPAHEEALEAARMLGVHFLVNAVPDPHGRGFLGVVAGNLERAHQAGVALCARAARAPFSELSDLTITCPGGYPRDIDLHQAQKALSVAEMVTRPGGVIVLVAECRNGTGTEFARWLQEAQAPQEVIERFEVVGWSEASGKAMMFARAAAEYTVILVSENFDQDFVESLFLHKADSLREAVGHAREILGSQPHTTVIPRAGGLIPISRP